MRKASIFVILAVLIVSLIGCSQQTDETGGNESAMPPSSFSAGETEETTPPSEETGAESETSAPIETDSADESGQAEISAQQAQSTTGSSQAATSKPTQTQPPVTSQTPAPQSTPTDPPKEPDPPVTPTPAPAFDPQLYVDYAISYGKSIGLQYEPEIGTGNWNSPLNLYASLTDESMKSGIRSSCDRLTREGFEYFWVSAVKQGDQSYQLFVYYG
jgi:hypothetical protein